MKKSFLRKNKYVYLITIWMLAIGTTSCAESRQMKSIDTMVNDLVVDLRKSRSIQRTALETMFGTHLRAVSENNVFQTYKSDKFRIGLQAAMLEFREEKSGGSATAGPLLIIDLLDGCHSTASIRDAYSPWTLLDYPRGESANERTSWSHKELWGNLVFSTQERTPDCLSHVAFQVGK